MLEDRAREPLEWRPRRPYEVSSLRAPLFVDGVGLGQASTTLKKDFWTRLPETCQRTELPCLIR